MINNIFYIIGSAPSLDNLTDEEWKHLENRNNIGIGYSMFTHKKFKFYLAYENEDTNKIIIDTIKMDGHLDTLLLIANRRVKSLLYALKEGFTVIPIKIYCSYFLPSRKPWFVDEISPPHPFKVCRAKSFNEDLFRYRGSLSASINVALILGATEIRLVGVDLDSQRDFWENHSRWCKNNDEKKILDKEYEIKLKNLEIKKGPDYNKIHTTATPFIYKQWGDRPLRGMLDVLEWMDKELRTEGFGGIYTTNKNSSLYINKKLQYKSIME